MSERMIELQRAKLGLPPAGASPSAPIHSSSQSSRSGSSQHAWNAAVQQTPQQAAAAALLEEDTQMQRFLHRLQRRDDSHPIADSTCGPTVPTALSRRMLHRQGVGYLDDTVAAITSASADRFLATVLQQAIACRDQRLKGAEMAREAARHRKRHMQNYQADTDDRKRRRTEKEAAREKKHLDAIAAADALKKGGAGAAKDAEEKKSKKKKKKPTASAAAAANANSEEPAANGKKQEEKNKDGDDDDDDEDSYDSIDEEEDYYRTQLGDPHVSGNLKRDDEDDDDVLILKDLELPLEAWGFRVTGKIGLEDLDEESDDGDGSGDVRDGEQTDTGAIPPDDVGNDDSMFPVGMDATATDGKQADDIENAMANALARRKSSSSPVPSSS